jgi:hypothetical protein
MKNFEKELTALVERVAPADLRIRYLVPSPKLEALLPKSMKGEKHYSVAFQTRAFDESGGGDSIRRAVELVLGSLENGPKDIDPAVPSWYALSRMQREVVEHALKGLVAQHKARAAAKNLAHERDAHTEYEIADAFEAALQCLELEYENEPGAVWEPMQARSGPAMRKPTDPAASQGDEASTLGAEQRKKLSTTVKELREKNKKGATTASRKSPKG